MPEFETPFTETEVLLAVMNDDREKMVALVSGMLNGEIEYLEKHADRLSRLCFRALADRGVSRQYDVGQRRDPWDPPSFPSVNPAKTDGFATMRAADDRSTLRDRS